MSTLLRKMPCPEEMKMALVCFAQIQASDCVVKEATYYSESIILRTKAL